MPPHQFGEGEFIAVREERSEQFAVGSRFGERGQMPGEGGSEMDHALIMSPEGRARAGKSSKFQVQAYCRVNQ